MKNLALFSAISLILIPTYSMADTSKSVTSASKSGFAIGLSMSNVGGDLGDVADATGANEWVPEINVSYTLRNGVFFGLTSSAMDSASGTFSYNGYRYRYDYDYGTGSVYGGYETDSGVRLKAGYAFAVVDSDYDGDYVFGGIMFGAGYVFNNGIMVDASITPKIDDSDSDDIDGSMFSASVGYKF